MPVPEGPTSEVGFELLHKARLVVESSCRVVVGVGIVAARSCGCDVAVGMVDFSVLWCGLLLGCGGGLVMVVWWWVYLFPALSTLIVSHLLFYFDF